MAAIENCTEVETREALSVEEFREEYLAKHRPVIIKKAVADWPAVNIWSDNERLKKRAGDLQVPLRSFTDYDEEGSQLLGSGDCVLENMTDFGNAIDVVANESDHTKMNYVRRFHLSSEMGLMRDLNPLPYLPPNEKPDGPYFWLGPGKTNTHFHWDPLPNLFCQVRGKKRWVLLSPSQAKLAYPVRFGPPSLVKTVAIRCRQPLWLLNPFKTFKFLNVFSVDGFDPDYELHPRFRGAQPLTCVVEAGDLLFVPYLWLHSVAAIDEVMSISVNWFFPSEERRRWRERLRALRTASIHYGLRDQGVAN